MLNLQFEETMKLTEEELQVVSGGDLVYTGNIPGSGIGTSRSITNFWRAILPMILRLLIVVVDI